MSDDWQIGDLALCIKQGEWSPLNCGPRLGEIHEVCEIDPADAQERCYLVFAKWFSEAGFGASRFIKVTPQEPDEFDAEVLFDLKYRSSPVFTDPTASELEAARSSSPRSATFPRLTGDAFGQSFQNAGGDGAECLAAPGSDVPFHKDAQ